MANAVQFEVNVPVELSLAFPEGKIVEGKFGDRVMFSLEYPYGQRMFLDLGVAQKINMLEIQPGEHFFLCKRQPAGTRRTMWDIWLSPATEKLRANRESAGSTVVAAAVARQAVAPPPAAPPAETPSMLERQLAASIAEVQARKEPQVATAAVESPALGTGTHGPVAVPRAQALAAAAPVWSGMLIAETNAMVDAFAACLEHANAYGNRVKPEDVRALLTTIYINRAKGAASHAA